MGNFYDCCSTFAIIQMLLLVTVIAISHLNPTVAHMTSATEFTNSMLTLQACTILFFRS